MRLQCKMLEDFCAYMPHHHHTLGEGDSCKMISDFCSYLAAALLHEAPSDFEGTFLIASPLMQHCQPSSLPLNTCSSMMQQSALQLSLDNCVAYRQICWQIMCLICQNYLHRTLAYCFLADTLRESYAQNLLAFYRAAVDRVGDGEASYALVQCL